jgi:hemerythrin superfamily protein
MTTTTQLGTADLVGLLLQDHGEAKRLLHAFDQVPPAERPEAFRHLVKVLVGHEAAEELVVYPALRECAAGGAAIARDRLAEQEHAERLLADMERLGVDDPGFEPSFRRLRDAVLEHAETEEHTVFWVLSSNLPHKELQRLAERYARAKQQAPTHPHPLSPQTPPANKVAGPLAGLLDRARDTARRRTKGSGHG